ncbi:putative membrane protein, partial [Neolecta irregularis DAH-3]
MVRVHPRLSLSEDFYYLLTFGPLYNTYREPAVFFSTVVLLTQLARGIIVGAVQTSGVAQIILLVVLEVIFLFSLLTWHPHPNISGMNGFNIFLSVCRLLVSLLSTIFIPQLELSNAAKQWMGYIILFIHAVVIFFGFFLSAIQVFVEMGARLAGAGDEALVGLGRAFGIQQLRKRNDTAVMTEYHQTRNLAPGGILLENPATPSTVFSQSHRSSNSRENYRAAKRARIQSVASATSRPWSLTPEDIAVQIEELELQATNPNPKVNYAVREADAWKQRSQPLSTDRAGRVRRLGTGPADP